MIEQLLKIYENEELQMIAQLVKKYRYSVERAIIFVSKRQEYLLGVFNDYEDVGKWLVKDSVIESPYLNVDMLLEHINYDKLGRRNAYHPNLILLELGGKILLYRED